MKKPFKAPVSVSHSNKVAIFFFSLNKHYKLVVSISLYQVPYYAANADFSSNRQSKTQMRSRNKAKTYYLFKILHIFSKKSTSRSKNPWVRRFDTGVFQFAWDLWQWGKVLVLTCHLFFSMHWVATLPRWYQVATQLKKRRRRRRRRKRRRNLQLKEGGKNEVEI